MSGGRVNYQCRNLIVVLSLAPSAIIFPGAASQGKLFAVCTFARLLLELPQLYREQLGSIIRLSNVTTRGKNHDTCIFLLRVALPVRTHCLTSLLDFRSVK